MIENICEFFNNLVCTIGQAKGSCLVIQGVILAVIGIFTFHLDIYWLIGFFFTRKFKRANHKHKYAILIPARNEEAVIGNLLDSIKKQNYDKELITVFVVADNCTDNTAGIARENGAICYERFNDKDRTKGFALQFLFENIERDYGIKSFEGYFIFDSDNLLKTDYISRMNDAFDAGEKIVTSYRNTKNFDENWIASIYALHWLRSIRRNHRARSALRLATNVQGTGFLFANELVENGWKYTSLTEDRAFTADAVAQGYRISYNDEAEFYDEQPTSLRIAWRQRVRWSKGHILAFLESGPALFVNIILGNHNKNKKEKNVNLGRRFLEGIRYRWISFDTFAQLVPRAIIRTFTWLVTSIFVGTCCAYANGIDIMIFDPNSNYIAKALHQVFGKVYLQAAPGVKAALYSVILVVIIKIISSIVSYINNIVRAVYLFFIERKRIKKMCLLRKAWYCMTWPIFDIIGRWSSYAALFLKVTWKPIPHNSKIQISDIEKSR